MYDTENGNITIFGVAILILMGSFELARTAMPLMYKTSKSVL